MRIFKYLPARWAIESLRTKRLKCSNPIKLNDPFEISPNIDPTKFDRNFIRRVALRDEMIREAYQREQPNIFPDYKSFKADWVKNIDDKVDVIQSRATENISREAANFANRYSEHWRIISFSKAKDSILLWSHYGMSHTGMALEFETKDEYISQIGSEDILEVVYSTNKCEFEPWTDVEGFMREVRKATMNKSLEWAYEQEVRIILASDALENDFFPFVGNPVKGVYLGIKTSEEDSAKVAKILGDEYYRNTKLKKAYPDDVEYKIRFTSHDIL